jgi:translation initiation factor 1A
VIILIVLSYCDYINCIKLFSTCSSFLLFVQVSLREYQDDKADVIYKYNPDEARNLKAAGELPNNIKINEGEVVVGGDDEDTVRFVEDNGGAGEESVEEEEDDDDLDIDDI